MADTSETLKEDTGLDDGPGEIRPADVRVAAMNLLARREHSLQELRVKLRRRFDDEAIIEEQLQQLAEENLQCDSRYAESFVRQRFNRGHGPLRIRQEMRHRGIHDEDIQAAMAAEDFDWYASAKNVLERKFGPVPTDDIKEKARRSRFMQYRGFNPEHFRNFL